MTKLKRVVSRTSSYSDETHTVLHIKSSCRTVDVPCDTVWSALQPVEHSVQTTIDSVRGLLHCCQGRQVPAGDDRPRAPRDWHVRTL